MKISLEAKLASYYPCISHKKKKLVFLAQDEDSEDEDDGSDAGGTRVKMVRCWGHQDKNGSDAGGTRVKMVRCWGH